MTPQQYAELQRQAETIEKDKQRKEINQAWKEIEEEYMKDEYPVFGGPFTNSLSPFEWLRRNYNPPTLREKI
jgi:radical SAM superfamily enzyme